jgi:thioredoxin 1
VTVRLHRRLRRRGPFARPDKLRGRANAVTVCMPLPNGSQVRPTAPSSPPTPENRVNPRHLKAMLAAFLIGLSTWAQALEIRPFDAAALARLQSDGQPVAVHFHADWCSTCVNQARALEQIRAGGQLQGMTVLVADYDRERELRRQLRVRSQSVLVVFKGTQEVARSGGQTQPEPLRQMLARAL